MASNHAGPEDDAIGSCLECAACLDLARLVDGRGPSMIMPSTKLATKRATKKKPPGQLGSTFHGRRRFPTKQPSLRPKLSGGACLA